MPTPKYSHQAPKHPVQGARTLGRISGRPAVFHFSRNAGGILALKSAGERVIAQLAELVPRVKSISPQPFALDVITGKVFKTRRKLEDARKTRSKIDHQKPVQLRVLTCTADRNADLGFRLRCNSQDLTGVFKLRKPRWSKRLSCATHLARPQRQAGLSGSRSVERALKRHLSLRTD